MFSKKKKGFTIVELVIVIGVIGVLAGILIPTFVNVKQKADEAALKSNLANAYSSYISDAADGKVDDLAAIGVTSGTYYILSLGQEKVTLKDAESIYEYTSAEGWHRTGAASGFVSTKKDIVLTALPDTFCDPAKTATYGGFEIWSTAARD